MSQPLLSYAPDNLDAVVQSAHKAGVFLEDDYEKGYPEAACSTPSILQPSAPRRPLGVSDSFQIDWVKIDSEADLRERQHASVAAMLNADGAFRDGEYYTAAQEFEVDILFDGTYPTRLEREKPEESLNPYTLPHVDLQALAFEYALQESPFQNNPIGLCVMYNHYARLSNHVVLIGPDGKPRVVHLPPGKEIKEGWVDIVVRVVFGTLYALCITNLNNGRKFSADVPWRNQADDGVVGFISQAELARKMMHSVFHLLWCPPGRGLFAIGTNLTLKRCVAAALNNCGFVSTAIPEAERNFVGRDLRWLDKFDTVNEDSSARTVDNRPIIELKTTWENTSDVYLNDKYNTFARSVCFLMDGSMCGIGIGFDTKGAGDVTFCDSAQSKGAVYHYTIPDTRAGWVASIALLMFLNTRDEDADIVFDYSLIRKKGERISTFGGTSAGGKVLKTLHQQMRTLFVRRHRQIATSRDITDIMNMVGACVMAGNVRRSAEIAFGACDDDDFASLKDYNDPKNVYRFPFAHASNNSLMICGDDKVDFETVVRKMFQNGEPGLFWLDHARQYGRMRDEENPPSEYDCPEHLDARARGANPCLEQTLEPYELCCLVETFPDRHVVVGANGRRQFDRDGFLETLQLALLYAKLVTTQLPEWRETRAVMERNRRIGCSMSGIAQFIAHHGREALKQCCNLGYNWLRACDQHFSAEFQIPTSIKLTSIKPSGTVSLLAGATPGIHNPISRRYIRRIRVRKDSDMARYFAAHGYTVEDSVTDKDGCCIEFPVEQPEGITTAEDQSVEEQVARVADLQRDWADNQVSCTIYLDVEKLEKECIERDASARAKYHRMQVEVVKVSTEAELMRNTAVAHVADIIRKYERYLKGLSMLPSVSGYAQLPYEPISEEEYQRKQAKTLPLRPIHDVLGEHKDVAPASERGCDGDTCSL